MNRRSLLASATGIAAAGAAIQSSKAQEEAATKHDFKLKYAPHFGMFSAIAGQSLSDQLKFAHDRGFTAWEDNRYLKRTPEEQKEIADTMTELGMSMGVFVLSGNAGATEPTFTVKNEDVWNGVLEEIKAGIEPAKQCNAKWLTVVPGAYDLKLDWNYQTANCIELLKRCSDILEPHGLVMVLEPLNQHANHPTMFLRESPQSFQICQAVGSPACKTLFDIYHQQITEGNLIPNIEKCWDEIGYFQAGDNPGRKEPGTGEINYRNVFKYIHDRSKKEGQDFIIGMEHGNSMKGAEGAEAVIQAYVDADNFSVEG
ncbi:MAG: xylose isomerase [Verrucomicrobiales bacterium]|nr:xylose isomerase [Verrucomicrobiales bacterium]